MQAVRACDQCGKTPAPVDVDSPIGLYLWNRYHPTDQRTHLYFCSPECTFRCGEEYGKRAREELNRNRLH